ncbi:ArnT family glycosyltransferase [Phaeodactylibacter luteus]|uniref:Phospholipid carrier-dependent glycosyltransferase n=1 Tax=Phaeodactylibacter luteus TaxID=1564516 RepID=A0A5C6S721_9BACT|nr:glycosyltransferase family 39 protein [Phaeodactylibacter luteus]TXB70199.1 phospholipid carrier-dependent glycosyltransferase [Phaeodactylibacter luteus]
MTQQQKAFLILLLLPVVVRLLSFFPSVIDHDESTYLVIADAISKGHTYQVDYIDTKPIGIFLIFAALKPLLGHSIFGYRLVAALTLGLTSFFLYRAKRSMGSTHAAGLAAGILYILLNSIYTRYGVSPNTETYFNLFTALSLWIFLSKPPVWGYFLAGIGLGAGFVIKYVVLFDGLAWGLFLVVLALTREGNVVKALARAFVMAIGAALPFALVISWYLKQGHFDTFWFHSFTVAGRYPSSRGLGHYLGFFFQFFARFLPATLLYVIALRQKELPGDTRLFGIIWSIATLCSVLIPGNAFGHYYIQFMLPFSFLAGEFFSLPAQQTPSWLRWARRPRIGYPLLGLLLIGHLLLQKKDYLDRPDNVRAAAAYIDARLQPGEAIYTQEDQAIYYLTDRLPLTRYVHPSLFWLDKHIEAMEIPLDNEIRKITAANPRFMVFRVPVEDERFAAYRTKYYEPVADIGGYVQIFERKK